MPERFSRYFEPFVGGGAVFFELRASHPGLNARLTDVNEELVHCYTAIRDDVEGVIEALSEHVYDSAHYYAVREQQPETLSKVARAARTIFLNKTGYNGLYRVNSKGHFNVPFGRYTRPKICDAKNLRACARALAGITIEVSDFSSVLNEASEGDFVYFDPPYVPLSPTSSFTSYIPGGFGESEQRTLAEVFAALAARGVFAMLSNSDAPLVRELYAAFDLQTVHAARAVNSNASKRGSITELVVRSWRAS